MGKRFWQACLNSIVWSDFNIVHQHSHNVVWTLDFNAGYQRSNNVTWMMCEHCDITLFPTLYQPCGNVKKLHNLTKLWHYCFNFMLYFCNNATRLWCNVGLQHCSNIVAKLYIWLNQNIILCYTPSNVMLVDEKLTLVHQYLR